jgi:adenylate cyclase
MSGFGNYRRDLAVLETSGGRIPQIHHNPPTAFQSSPNQIAPWMSTNGSIPSPGFGTSFYNDSSDNLSQGSQLSPGFRPGTGVTGNTNASDSPADPYFGDERRPSVASVTTASSSGSKSSVNRGGIHKQLKTFFGDDFPGKDGSDTSLPSHGKDVRSHSFARSQRDRNHSSATDHTQRDASPAGSRPRTPVPSSDVVPFLYQDSQVSQPIYLGSSSSFLAVRRSQVLCNIQDQFTNIPEIHANPHSRISQSTAKRLSDRIFLVPIENDI